jgi:hypothetical protein
LLRKTFDALANGGTIAIAEFLAVEKIVSKSGMFSCAENVVSKHHVYHAIHHNFTTKTPQSAHPFSQKPLQKHLSTSIQKKSP